MYDTMYNASGGGLAAPQIGKSIKIFIIDTSPFLDMDSPWIIWTVLGHIQRGGLKKKAWSIL